MDDIAVEDDDNKGKLAAAASSSSWWLQCKGALSSDVVVDADGLQASLLLVSRAFC